jgi:ribosome-associated toxin RatA of RatAB toxin-antitoxin module
VPVYEATREIIIAASAADCFAVLTDYDQMPRWQSRVRCCRVRARGPDGLPREVDYEIDAKLRTVRYRLRHLYRPPRWIGSEYLGGDFRGFEGDYRLLDGRAGTSVRFQLRVDPGLRVPAGMARMLGDAVMGRSLEDLRKRMETLGHGPQ